MRSISCRSMWPESSRSYRSNANSASAICARGREREREARERAARASSERARARTRRRRARARARAGGGVRRSGVVMKNSRRSTSPLASASKIAKTRLAKRVRGSPSRSSISVMETSPRRPRRPCARTRVHARLALARARLEHLAVLPRVGVRLVEVGERGAPTPTACARSPPWRPARLRSRTSRASRAVSLPTARRRYAVRAPPRSMRYSGLPIGGSVRVARAAPSPPPRSRASPLLLFCRARRTSRRRAACRARCAAGRRPRSTRPRAREALRAEFCARGGVARRGARAPLRAARRRRRLARDRARARRDARPRSSSGAAQSGRTGRADARLVRRASVRGRRSCRAEASQPEPAENAIGTVAFDIALPGG